MTCLSSGLVALAALATGGMGTPAPDYPVQMSNLKITSITNQGMAGYEVVDVKGARVGEVAKVTTDDHGRARWIMIDLDDGGEARLASFRAMLDARQKTVQLKLPYDLVVQRAEPETLSSLST